MSAVQITVRGSLESRHDPANGPGDFALRPDDVEIAAEVEAVFTVHPGG